MEERKRKSASHLINYPFEILGKMNNNGTWRLEIKNLSHNHPSSDKISGHPYARHFSQEEIEHIKEMNSAGVYPRQILASLRQKNSNLRAISKTLYNSKTKNLKEDLASHSWIQTLLEELGKDGFIYDYEYSDNDCLSHFFFSHPLSYALTKSYSHIFDMYCTYKTNRFEMPLLDVIGVSSFNTSFYSCFAFMQQEREEDYIWALTKFRKMLGIDVQPAVIVLDRELALMKAIKVVFPKTANLLCVWHIEKNLVVNCKRHFEKNEDRVIFKADWIDLINSSSESSFGEVWSHFQVQYQSYVQILNYITKTWLPFKEHFVSAWLEKYLHFGNRVTSRAKGAHAKLKGYLQVSTCDLHTIKDRIHHAIENQFQEVRVTLSSEKIRIPHEFGISLFKNLVTCVSIAAFEKLYKQYELALSDSLSTICKGYFLKTMALPCAHKLRAMENERLQLDDIHPQ